MSENFTIEIKKLSDKAKTPTQGSLFAAGYDLYSAENCKIKAGQRRLVKTDIAIRIPNGFYGRIAPRSGLALKEGLDVLAGVIDSDYKFEIGVLLFNNNLSVDNDDYIYDVKSANSAYIKTGDRIAQLIIEKCYYPTEWVEVQEIKETNRSGGFGSTGI